VADKYIEYDPVIVMIDLVLLNEQAYRHVLYNSSFHVSYNCVMKLKYQFGNQVFRMRFFMVFPNPNEYWDSTFK
jgi:hypothetical protein